MTTTTTTPATAAAAGGALTAPRAARHDIRRTFHSNALTLRANSADPLPRCGPTSPVGE